MSSPSDILVIGSGVLGLASAAGLAARGHSVTVIDPGGLNASRVAAGMIAPALEAAIEDVSPERAALLRAARDLWPAFAAATGITLLRDGAEWRGADAPAMVERMRVHGFEAWLENGAAFTPDDWRIIPEQALAALGSVAGVRLRRATVTGLERTDSGWRATLDGGAECEARVVVLASGAAAPIPGLPEPVRRLVDSIQPIRGQLDHVAGLTCGRVARGTGAYVVPARDGALIGASMEPGRRDLPGDPQVSERILTAAARFFDVGGAGERTSFVGVRGATPDGLPLAGEAAPGLLLVLAPRRNGWLLAPAVAAVTVDALEGGSKTAFTAAFDPRRFI